MSALQKSLIGAGILALLANLFFFRSAGVTAAALVLLFFNVYILITGYKGKSSINIFSGAIELCALVFLTLSVIRGTPIIQILLLASSLGCTGLLVYLLHSGNEFFTHAREIFLLPFVLAGTYLTAAFDTVFPAKRESSNKPVSGISRQILSTIAGLVIGIPVVFVLVALLSQADPIFAKTVKNILGNFSLPLIADRLLGSAIVFCIAVPFGVLSIRSNIFNKENTKLPESLLHPMTIVMSLIGVTLATFLAIQWPYVFAHVGAETDLSQFGVATYSEYVKRGFIEFLFIAGILYSLVWSGLLALRAKKQKSLHPLQVIQSFVMILFMIFLISVGRRIMLYWELHGLSLIRIYGGIFLLWVGFLSLLLWARQFFAKTYVGLEVFGTLAFIMFVGTWNAESFIVSHHPPTVNNVVDTVYLSRLSSDGYQGWQYSYQQAVRVVNRQEYLQKGILDANDRREIAYAGITLASVTNNYHDLLEQYGSSSEKQAYMNQLFTRETPRIIEITRMFERDLNIIQRKGNTATVSAAAYASPSHTGQDIGSLLSNYIPELRSSATIAGQLATTSGEKKKNDLVYEFSPRSSRSVASYEEGTCLSYFYFGSDFQQSTSCVPSFYILRAHQEKNLTTLDWIYRWNKTDQEVFQRLKADIRLEELFQLQDSYIRLWEKILSQPEKDREIHVDISFDAPFVDSID